MNNSHRMASATLLPKVDQTPAPLHEVDLVIKRLH
ncbi:hypothetical protein AB7M22_003509 [Pseudomonas sp. ADAK2 TE3594]